MAGLDDVFRTMGASNHTDKQRQSDDYYATDPVAARLLLEKIPLDGPIWECACGGGHLSGAFAQAGYPVRSSDIIDRGCPGCEILDFLSCTDAWDGDIVTNPPYRHAEAFVRKALDLVPDGRRVCMLLKLTFLEGLSRRNLFLEHPPEKILVFSRRLLCAKNGKFDEMRAGGGGIQAYAWFVWKKGRRGDSVVDWICHG